MASITGRTRSTAASSPPTNMSMSPRIAPSTAPVTGASTGNPPRSANACPSVRMSEGLLVVRSIQVLPAQSAANRPFSPRATCSISFGPNTIATTASTAARTAAGLAPHSAPSSINGRAASARISWTTRGKPRRMMLRAAGAPMVPSPMKPTFIIAGPPVPGVAALSRAAARRLAGTSTRPSIRRRAVRVTVTRETWGGSRAARSTVTSATPEGCPRRTWPSPGRASWPRHLGGDGAGEARGGGERQRRGERQRPVGAAHGDDAGREIGGRRREPRAAQRRRAGGWGDEADLGDALSSPARCPGARRRRGGSPPAVRRGRARPRSAPAAQRPPETKEVGGADDDQCRRCVDQRCLDRACARHVEHVPRMARGQQAAGDGAARLQEREPDGRARAGDAVEHGIALNRRAAVLRPRSAPRSAGRGCSCAASAPPRRPPP